MLKFAMNQKKYRNNIRLWMAVFFAATLHINCQEKVANFVCPPCDAQCDTLTFEEDGVCPHCKLNLIMNVNESMVNEVAINEGSGNFIIAGGQHHTEKIIRVFYHRPGTLDATSKVLLVLPGAGRNGNDYRDAWVAHAEKYNVVVISPEYSEKHYPQFWNYNLAGMITDVVINKERTAMTAFKLRKNPNEWLYNDFDRMFDLVKKALHLNTATYDMFGHSAGGQLLHRFALFKSDSKANRILASNAGWYTVPDASEEFPVGLKNSNKAVAQIDFSTNLILFLGEKDDANETRGDLRRSPEVDKQGLYRVARGNYFYQTSKRTANELEKEFNWKLEIVPNVGHDFGEMSKAAAAYLYDLPKE
ncbi:hypothetical protein N9954_03275 [Maribacter sp.]|nr:hypothetical protein [Maribacter sp.]